MWHNLCHIDFLHLMMSAKYGRVVSSRFLDGRAGLVTKYGQDARGIAAGLGPNTQLFDSSELILDERDFNRLLKRARWR